MNRYEFELIKNFIPPKKFITINDLENQKDRTLLYGFTSERFTFHVYLFNKEIHKVIYNHNNKFKMKYEIAHNQHYMTDKRFYSECCDFEFCVLLKKAEVNVDDLFTTFDDNRPQKTFHGLIWEELEQS